MTSRSIAVSVAGLLIALTGVLIDTSVFNTSTSGIPFYYLMLLIPLLSGLNPQSPFLSATTHGAELEIYVTVGLQAAALICVTMIQIAWFSLDGASEFVHLSARIMPLVYFAICIRYVRRQFALSTLYWLRRILIVVFLYGVYQLPAKFLGLPLFLDWLRNNKSNLLYKYDAAGWTDMIRSTSIFSEPSQAMIPIIVAILLNLYLPAGRLSRIIGWLSIIAFSLASASRSSWLAIAGLIFGCFISKVGMLRPWLTRRRFVTLAAIIIAILILPSWALIDANMSHTDLSQQERSGSVLLGISMIQNSPLIGFGWNSAGRIADKYLRQSTLPAAANIQGEFIQSMPVSYWEQAGLAGLMLAVLPLFAIWKWHSASPGLRWGTLCSFLVAGGVADFGYISLSWLWIALLVNMGTISDPRVADLQDRSLPSSELNPTALLST
jgi:hypothetical protein